MAEVDFNSRVTTPRYGEPVTAGMMAKIKHLILNCVKAGNGIQVNRVGQSVVISLQPAPKGGGTGGGASDWITATTKAGLAAPPSNIYMARVDGVGTDDGMVCVANPDGSGWDAINFFE